MYPEIECPHSEDAKMQGGKCPLQTIVPMTANTGGDMKKTYFCLWAEFYDTGKVKACITSRKADNLPNNQYRQTPGMSALKIWFGSIANAMQLLDSIKKDEYSLDDILQFYSSQQDIKRRA